MLLSPGCVKHDNPLDPENEETRGIGFAGIYSVNYPFRIRVSGSNHLFTLPSGPSGGHIEKFSFQDNTLLSQGIYQPDGYVRDIGFSPDSREAALISYNRLIFIDTESMTYLDEVSVGSVSYFLDVCYNTGGDRIYASSGTTDEIFVFSRTTRALIETITGVPEVIFRLQVAGDFLYAFSYSTTLIVTRFDIREEATDTQQWNTNFKAYPVIEDIVAYVPSRNYIYYSDGTQLIYGEVRTPFQPQTVPSLENCRDISVDPLDDFLFVHNGRYVDVYLLSPFQKLSTIDLEEQVGTGFSIYGIEAMPDGKSLFINSIYPVDRIARVKVRF